MGKQHQHLALCKSVSMLAPVGEPLCPLTAGRMKQQEGIGVVQRRC